MPATAERLVRGLVGVADAVVVADASGRIRRVVVRPSPGVSDRQVIPNVASALRAALGVALAPATIVLSRGVAELDRERSAGVVENGVGQSKAAGGVTCEAEPVSGADSSQARIGQPEPAPRAQMSAAPTTHEPPADGPAEALERSAGSSVDAVIPATAPGGNGTRAHPPVIAARTNGALTRPQPESTTPPGIPRRPRLAEIRIHDLARRRRCSVLLELDGRRFLAVAEEPRVDGPAVELAARTAVDALRTARFPDAPLQFAGATLTFVRDAPYAIATLDVWNGHDFETRCGAAPVRAAAEEAAARAVLRAALDADTDGNTNAGSAEITPPDRP